MIVVRYWDVYLIKSYLVMNWLKLPVRCISILMMTTQEFRKCWFGKFHNKKLQRWKFITKCGHLRGNDGIDVLSRDRYIEDARESTKIILTSGVIFIHLLLCWRCYYCWGWHALSQADGTFSPINSHLLNIYSIELLLTQSNLRRLCFMFIQMKV